MLSLHDAVQKAIDRAGGVVALAEKLGVTHAAVSQWRSGETKPCADHVVAIYRMLEHQHNGVEAP